MSPQEAEALQRAFVEMRRQRVHDPELGIAPWPKRRTRKLRPEPATLDDADPELG